MWVSWTLRRRALSSPACVAALAAAFLVLALAATLPVLQGDPVGKSAAPPAGAGVDARFIPLGKGYLPLLGRAYAAGWVEGAKALEAGRPVDAALAEVGRTWDSSRTALFDRLLTPQFNRIVPEGRDDVATTQADKLALARAWRGLAQGLDPQSR